MATSIFPPLVLRVIPLLVANVKSVVVFKVPPLKVSCVAVRLAAVPKLASAPIEIVPALIVVIPV